MFLSSKNCTKTSNVYIGSFFQLVIGLPYGRQYFADRQGKIMDSFGNCLRGLLWGRVRPPCPNRCNWFFSAWFLTLSFFSLLWYTIVRVALIQKWFVLWKVNQLINKVLKNTFGVWIKGFGGSTPCLYRISISDVCNSCSVSSHGLLPTEPQSSSKNQF